MTRASVTQTSFTAGELDPLLLGRLDLKAQEEGAAKLRNVVVHPTGGVSRRPGLRLVLPLPGVARLIAFDGPDGGELLALGEHRLDVVKNDAVVRSFADTLWSLDHLPDLSAARWGDRLFLCHPDVPPHELARAPDGSFELRPWAFERDLAATGYQRELQPFAKFARPECFVELADRTEQPIAPGTLVPVRASEPVFTSEHIDAVLRVREKDLRVVNVDPLNPQLAFAVALERLDDGKPTRDWAEQAFSEARGWPACVAVYQERLVVGGSRDLPDRLWFSRTGHPLDFAPVKGDADEGFSFRLVGDEHHAVRGLMPGRLLQVLTGSGEWIVRGNPLGPGTVEVELQTRVGSYPARRIEPIDVDGATLFVGASGRELREFLYAESEQAYQAADIALLSRHLLADPVGLAFDRRRRWLLATRADGRLAVAAIDRNSNVVAWSLFEAAGTILGVVVHRGEPHLLLDLDGRQLLERFDDALGTDHTVAAVAAEPTPVLAGLDHLEGREVLAVAAGAAPARAVVGAGAIVLPAPVTAASVGTPFAHVVEPLPLAVPGGSGVSLDRPYRPVRVVFRVQETGALRVDLGQGLRPVDLASLGADDLRSGDLAIRALGWRRGAARPPWRVEQDDPVPCTVLSVTTDIKGEA